MKAHARREDRLDAGKAVGWVLIIVLLIWCWFWIASLADWLL